MRILVVATALPFPPVSGGGRRSYHLIRALATRHDVTLVGFVYDGEPLAAPAYPVRMHAVHWHTPPLYAQLASEQPAEAARALRVLAQELEEPWIASYYASDEMRSVLSEEAAHRPELVFFLGSDIARYADCFAPGVPVAVDLMDVLSRIAERAAAVDPGAAQEARRTRAWESGIAHRAQLLCACSADEARAAERLLDVGEVAVVANGVDTQRFVPPAHRPAGGRLLFAGHMAHAPNREAVRWFVAEVMPALRVRGCRAVLDVVGARSREELADLAARDVVLHGLVPDTLPFHHHAAVVVAPIRSGGGTRLKILEAAAAGNAIVSTTLGAEGLGLSAADAIELADDASTMAGAIEALLDQPRRREDLGRRARAVVLGYDWTRIEAGFADLIERRFGREMHAVAR